MASSYICTSTNREIQKIVNKANEIMNLYFRNNYFDRINSFLLSKDFFQLMNRYFFNKLVYNTVNELKKDFIDKFGEEYSIIFNEYSLAYFRLKNIQKHEILDFHIDHNANLINLILYQFGMVDRKIEEFGILNKNILDNEPYFNRDEESRYKGRAMLFYRNAYRADLYCRKINGNYDMYTPLILTRMAIEQFVKARYESNVGNCGDLTASKIISVLKDEKINTSAFSNELYSILIRGNVNTHEGYANYSFAIIHGIEVLKFCLEYFDGKRK